MRSGAGIDAAALAAAEPRWRHQEKQSAFLHDQTLAASYFLFSTSASLTLKSVSELLFGRV